MNAAGPSAHGFLKLYDSTARKSEERLKRFLADPTAANLHSVRASARRMETMIAIMPRGTRERRGARAYSKALRRVSKVTSEAGDCDTAIALLTAPSSQGGAPRLLGELRARRSVLDARATAAARRLLRRRPPRPIEGDLSPRKLRRRYAREVASCLREGLAEYEVASADPGRKREFHRMRRRFRDLRYLLRLSGDDAATSRPLEALISLQDSLGAIRDLDVLLELHLRGGVGSRSPLARDLQARRAELFRQFQASAPDALEALGSLS